MRYPRENLKNKQYHSRELNYDPFQKDFKLMCLIYKNNTSTECPPKLSHVEEGASDNSVSKKDVVN